MCCLGWKILETIQQNTLKYTENNTVEYIQAAEKRKNNKNASFHRKSQNQMYFLPPVLCISGVHYKWIY